MRFIAWTKLKVRIYLKPHEKTVYFDEREIWWDHLGANIGYEQDGKNDNFERPVLVIRKFGKHSMWVLPQTSKPKEGIYYHKYTFDGKS